MFWHIFLMHLLLTRSGFLLWILLSPLVSCLPSGLCFLHYWGMQLLLAKEVVEVVYPLSVEAHVFLFYLALDLYFLLGRVLSRLLLFSLTTSHSTSISSIGSASSSCLTLVLSSSFFLSVISLCGIFGGGMFHFR